MKGADVRGLGFPTGAEPH